MDTVPLRAKLGGGVPYRGREGVNEHPDKLRMAGLLMDSLLATELELPNLNRLGFKSPLAGQSTVLYQVKSTNRDPGHALSRSLRSYVRASEWGRRNDPLRLIIRF